MCDDLILPSRAEREEALYFLGELRETGFSPIGTDEAGRGALAGPVIAAAVYLTVEQENKLLSMGLKDSKRVTYLGREKIFKAMNDMGVLWCADSGGIERIDRDNILNASLWAMGQSVTRLDEIMEEMEISPSCVIVDGIERIPDINIPQWVLVGADNLIPSVSAASIIAKVIRDRIMINADGKYPDYNFEKNKGYPTAYHIDILKKLGMTDIHRRTFCRKILHGKEQE